MNSIIDSIPSAPEVKLPMGPPQTIRTRAMNIHNCIRFNPYQLLLLQDNFNDLFLKYCQNFGDYSIGPACRNTPRGTVGELFQQLMKYDSSNVVFFTLGECTLIMDLHLALFNAVSTGDNVTLYLTWMQKV
jgi:hypothetical protein